MAIYIVKYHMQDNALIMVKINVRHSTIDLDITYDLDATIVINGSH